MTEATTVQQNESNRTKNTKNKKKNEKEQVNKEKQYTNWLVCAGMLCAIEV